MPPVREFSLVVLANTRCAAIQHARRLGRREREILIITIRADLYLLYGKQGIPFDVVPGTYVQWWHQQIERHIQWGRIVRVRTHCIVGELMLSGVTYELTDGIERSEEVSEDAV